MRTPILVVICLLCQSSGAFAQVPKATKLTILKAEDERNFSDELEAFLSDKNPELRARAALAAGRIGDARAVTSLVKLLKSDDSAQVKSLAAFALGLVASPLATDALITALRRETQPPEVRARMLEALGTISQKKGAELSSIQSIIAKALKFEISFPSNQEVLSLGLTAAARAKAGLPAPLLDLLLSDPRDRVRESATEAMARLKVKTKKAGALLQNDPDPVVRANATRIFEFTDAKEAFALLLSSAQNDPDLRVRVSAVRALSRLGNAEAIAPLLARAKALQESISQNRNEFLEIVTALGTLLKGTDDDAVFSWLRKDWPLGSEVDVEVALAKISPASYLRAITSSQLQRILASDFRPAAALAQALEQVKDNETLTPRAAQILRTLLNNKNTQTNYRYAIPTILNVLSELKVKDLTATFTSFLKDPDPNIVDVARDLLKLPPNAPFTPAKKNTLADYERALARSGRTVHATIETSKGSFEVEFFPSSAPLTVDNFIALAQNHFFDGQRIPRVVPNFVVQAGDPRGDQNGGPGYTIRCEINTIPYEVGTLGMALSGKDTGGSQWFVTLAPQANLDGGYTVFGKVILGMQVVDQLTREDKVISVHIEQSK